MNVKIDFPQDFLMSETECGYVVTEEMKKIRLVQLELLCELKRVCRKYGLTYYADSGTLIGAVRHQGYIPWDDDIDVVMKRKDYSTLLRVASEEFRHPFFLQTTYNDVNYVRGHAQLRNSVTAGYSAKEEGKPYNRGIFIDILPLDNIADNKLLFKIQKIRSRYLFTLMELGVNHNDRRYVKKNNRKRYVAAQAMHFFFKIYDYRKMYRHFERVCSKYNDRPTENLGCISYSFGKYVWKSSWYDKSHEVPFEFTTINIPDGYEGRLRSEYGDYMEIKNLPSDHGRLVLSADLPYNDYRLAKKTGSRNGGSNEIRLSDSGSRTLRSRVRK